jgi:hypothetical protein
MNEKGKNYAAGALETESDEAARKRADRVEKLLADWRLKQGGPLRLTTYPRRA